MEKIIIENFGPVSYFNAIINEKMTVLVGEQATGKSTISKLIFYCRSLKDEFYKNLLDKNSFTANGEGQVMQTYLKEVRRKFVGTFGTTKHMKQFKVKYYYDFNQPETKYVVLTLKNGYTQITFSQDLLHGMYNIIKNVADFYKDEYGSNLSEKDFMNFTLWQNRQAYFLNSLQNEIGHLFSDDLNPIFIPAGRSILITMPEHLILSNEVHDRLMKDFMERILLLRNQFSKHLEEIIEDKKSYSNKKIKFNDVNAAMEIYKKILKGEYLYDKDGEKIYINNDEWVKLTFASSGQQESLWILLLLFSIILEDYHVFLVIEEPEAHLFPQAQKLIVELIALMANSTGGQIVITTHSPYILSSINLLIQSGNVENAIKNDEVIIEQNRRLNKGEVGAYLLEMNPEFSYNSIIDEDTGLIMARVIDSVSEIINLQSEKLIDLEVSHEMQ